jgi:nitroreductase
VHKICEPKVHSTSQIGQSGLSIDAFSSVKQIWRYVYYSNPDEGHRRLSSSLHQNTLKNHSVFPLEVYNVENNEEAYRPFKDEAQIALFKCQFVPRSKHFQLGYKNQ